MIEDIIIEYRMTRTNRTSLFRSCHLIFGGENIAKYRWAWKKGGLWESL